MKVFHEWLKDRGSDTQYTESDLWSEDAEKVCEMLSKFIAEARQTNGEPYSPKTLGSTVIHGHGTLKHRGHGRQRGRNT